MPAYDFRTLSPFDFEQLVRDLLQEELGIRLESFKRGRDDGIDLRGLLASGDVAGQCKHYADSGYGKLLSHLALKEAPKVAKLKPNRYILATSVGLTPRNKDDIVAVFKPYCRGPEDVLGADDLNNLLGKHTAIEQRHFKLWLTSTGVLQALLHSDLINESAAERERIAHRLKLYVHHRSYFRAAELLNKYHYCVIAGQPGIGKTTLAEILSVAHLGQGYQVVIISDDIRDAFALLAPLRKQLFVYDDFLGQTSLEAKLHKNEEHALVRLLDAVGRSQTARLLLTTREYILNQARQVHEKLATANIDIARCTITVESYSALERAAILHNHVWFSHLPTPYKSALLAKRSYRRILAHPNYVPRIIQDMTEPAIGQAVAPGEYVERFLYNLDHPHELWRHAFEHQLSSRARHLLLVVFTAPGMTLEDVGRVFESYHASVCTEFHLPRDAHDLRLALAELEQAFVTIDPADIWGERQTSTIRFHHPSIADFVEAQVAESQQEIRRLAETATAFEQVVRIWKAVQSHLGTLPPEVGDALWEAADRLFEAKSVTLGASTRSTHGIAKYWRVTAGPEERLIALCEMAEAYKGPRSDDILKWRGEQYRDALTSGRSLYRTSAARKLLDYLHYRRVDIGVDVAELAQAIKTQILEEGLSGDDLGVLSSLAYRDASIFTDEDRRSMEHAIEQYLAYNLSDTSDLEDLDELKGVLGRLKRDLDLDLDGAISEVRERKNQVETEDEEHTDFHYDAWRDAAADLREQEAQIDRMFEVFVAEGEELPPEEGDEPEE